MFRERYLSYEDLSAQLRAWPFTVAGSGTLRLRIGSSRTGWIERTVEVAAT